MKYIAILDDELLSNFRVDMRSNNHLSEMVFVVTDDAGFTRGIGLKPLRRPMIVSEDGLSAYLSQSHIDCLLEMERQQTFDNLIKDLKSNLFKEK